MAFPIILLILSSIMCCSTICIFGVGIFGILGFNSIIDSIKSAIGLGGNSGGGTLLAPQGVIGALIGTALTDCKKGFTPGPGLPDNCYEDCPSGFDNTLATCTKQYWHKSTYGWQGGDPVFNYDKAKDRCLHDNPQGCTQYGAIWYANCPSNMSDVAGGFTDCHSVCPSDMSDGGVFCTKNMYNRRLNPTG